MVLFANQATFTISADTTVCLGTDSSKAKFARRAFGVFGAEHAAILGADETLLTVR